MVVDFFDNLFSDMIGLSGFELLLFLCAVVLILIKLFTT